MIDEVLLYGNSLNSGINFALLNFPKFLHTGRVADGFESAAPEYTRSSSLHHNIPTWKLGKRGNARWFLTQLHLDLLKCLTLDWEEFKILLLVVDRMQVAQLLGKRVERVVLFQRHWEELLSELLEGLRATEGNLILSARAGVGKHIIIVASW
jgi:hypothetical protein